MEPGASAACNGSVARTGKIWRRSSAPLPWASTSRIRRSLRQWSQRTIVAHAVKSRKDSIIIATKVPPKNLTWPARLAIPMEEVFRADSVVECTEASLRNLERESADLQQFHVWNSEWLKQEGWQEGMERIKRAGKTRFIGISVNDHQPASVIPALRTGLFDTIQVIYTRISSLKS